MSIIWTNPLLFAAEIFAPEDAPEEFKPLWELGSGAGALHTPDYPTSSQKHVRATGSNWTFQLQYKHIDFMSPKLDATISLQPQWASLQLHEYFFDVKSDYVTEGRSEYRSKGGYFGTGLNLYASYRVICLEASSRDIYVRYNATDSFYNEDGSEKTREDFCNENTIGTRAR